ncbi:ribokinase [Salinibacterium sp. dk2585]|uniref:ribokinase n=1 Tax=unclassified Salinibacterium TaxID=2632331 RepID=UPI0011C244FF|nr:MULTISPECIES: ribokinase [unclassified Salinibacterium]QEE62128.1 ribokinase [Salinibacterium sp. dk2585]TXK53480.1 ribokinase [Salinibacterium sp. dk5596]
MDVVVVGSINLDLMVGVDRLPAVGETVLGEAIARLPGGKGFNQAVAAARSGAQVRFCGGVGDDGDGAFLRSHLRAAGLDDRMLGVDSSLPTGLAHITVLPDSGNAIIVSQGANGSLTARDAAAAVKGAGVVLAQLEVPADAVEAALSAGRAAGAVTVLNAAPTTAFRPSLLAHVDILVVNESEARDLGGLDHLVAAGPRTVVMTLGEKGAVWRSEGDSGQVAAFPIEAVDTTGAGDAFCGALVASLAQGHDIAQALRRASAAGAITAQHLGAQVEQLSLEAIERMLGA